MNITQSKTWNIDDEILDEIATDLITTAVEGGINYWAEVNDYKWDCPTDQVHATVVAEGEDDEPVTVDVAKMKAAMIKLVTGDNTIFFSPGYTLPYKTRLSDLFDEIERYHITLDMSQDYDFDAGDADCMFQLAAFGEVVYG